MNPLKAISESSFLDPQNEDSGAAASPVEVLEIYSLRSR